MFRTESTWQAIAWSTTLTGTAAAIAALIRIELLIRSPDRGALPAGR